MNDDDPCKGNIYQHLDGKKSTSQCCKKMLLNVFQKEEDANQILCVSRYQFSRSLLKEVSNHHTTTFIVPELKHLGKKDNQVAYCGCQGRKLDFYCLLTTTQQIIKKLKPSGIIYCAPLLPKHIVLIEIQNVKFKGDSSTLSTNSLIGLVKCR